jgi:hypothetical protein
MRRRPVVAVVVVAAVATTTTTSTGKQCVRALSIHAHERGRRR